MSKQRKPNGYWTLERLKEEALKYPTKIAFKLGNESAYQAARKIDVLAQVCAHMQKRPTQYTNQEIFDAAKLYTRRTDFRVGPHASHYDQARKRGLLETATAHMPNVYKFLSDDDLAKTAKQYQGRFEFEKSDRNSYMVAARRGILDTICAHMERQCTEPGYWTKERCQACADQCVARYQFQEDHPGAYQAAYRNGWVDEICLHMGPGLNGDMDVIYIWEAVNESYNGKKVYKIGITSDRLGSKRIERVAQKAGMEARIVLMRWLGRWYVPGLERYLLTFGEDPKLDVPDGRTEFRALTDEELQVIIKIIESHPIL